MKRKARPADGLRRWLAVWLALGMVWACWMAAGLRGYMIWHASCHTDVGCDREGCKKLFENIMLSGFVGNCVNPMLKDPMRYHRGEATRTRSGLEILAQYLADRPRSDVASLSRVVWLRHLRRGGDLCLNARERASMAQMPLTPWLSCCVWPVGRVTRPHRCGICGLRGRRREERP